MDLVLEIFAHEDVTVVHCRGQLVYGPEASEFVQFARRLVETDKKVVLQMAELTQIDSGGVGALGTAFMTAHNRAAEIKLATLHPRVAEVLRITGLQLLFDMHGSENEAIAAFTRKKVFVPMGLESA